MSIKRLKLPSFMLINEIRVGWIQSGRIGGRLSRKTTFNSGYHDEIMTLSLLKPLHGVLGS